MKQVSKIIIAFFLVGTISYVSCKKVATDKSSPVINRPPVANAGNDTLIILPADSVMLDGSRSSDPDDGIAGYQWKKIAGPDTFNIMGASAVKTMVNKLVRALYRFELTVTDKGGLSAKDTVVITVNISAAGNRPPVANAGNDSIIILPSNPATLDGSKSYDPDNNISSYAWTKITGPSAVGIFNANGVKAAATDLVEGIFQFELKVTDSFGLFSKDTMTLRVNAYCDNSNRPLINAQLVPFGKLSQLREGMAVASAGNKILFAGANASYTNGSPFYDYGSSRVDIYDRVTQTWSTAELSKSRSDIAAVAAGNKVFFAGGENGDGDYNEHFSTVDIYDVSTNTWTVATLSEPRSKIAAAVAGNKVFFAGGEKTWSYNTSNKVDIYDISSNSWSTAQLGEERAFISAVTVNNKIYFAGGHKEDRWHADPSARIDIYDNATNTWSAAVLNKPMGFLAGINVGENIYWSSGCTVEIKNVNTWSSSMNQLFKPVDSWNIDAGQNVVVKDNKLIFFGYGRVGNRFDIYDINTNTWSIGVLPQNIVGASIISVNNTIYMAGGLVNGIYSNQVWTLEF